jgi:hypothetical protein
VVSVPFYTWPMSTWYPVHFLSSRLFLFSPWLACLFVFFLKEIVEAPQRVFFFSFYHFAHVLWHNPHVTWSHFTIIALKYVKLGLSTGAVAVNTTMVIYLKRICFIFTNILLYILFRNLNWN